MTKYTHLELNQEQRFLPGYYIPTKETRMEYDGREVLYVVGQAVLDCSCCGCGSFTYAIVPGYIVAWQTEKNEQGLPVTDVEPVRDSAAQDSIRKTIRQAENVTQVDFW